MTEADDDAGRRDNALPRLMSPTGGSIAQLYWRDPRTIRRVAERPAADDWTFAPDDDPSSEGVRAAASRLWLACVALLAITTSLAVMLARAS